MPATGCNTSFRLGYCGCGSASSTFCSSVTGLPQLVWLCGCRSLIATFRIYVTGCYRILLRLLRYTRLPVYVCRCWFCYVYGYCAAPATYYTTARFCPGLVPHVTVYRTVYWTLPHTRAFGCSRLHGYRSLVTWLRSAVYGYVVLHAARVLRLVCTLLRAWLPGSLPAYAYTPLPTAPFLRGSPHPVVFYGCRLRLLHLPRGCDTFTGSRICCYWIATFTARSFTLRIRIWFCGLLPRSAALRFGSTPGYRTYLRSAFVLPRYRLLRFFYLPHRSTVLPIRAYVYWLRYCLRFTRLRAHGLLPHACPHVGWLFAHTFWTPAVTLRFLPLHTFTTFTLPLRSGYRTHLWLPFLVSSRLRLFALRGCLRFAHYLV